MTLTKTMPLFINTRPIQRAKPLTEALQSLGIEVLALPLLEIKPLTLSCGDSQKLMDVSVGQYDVLVVVSPSAGEFGCQLLEHSLEKTVDNSTKIVTVGQATADTLADFGLSPIAPKIANNEGMLSLDCLTRLNHNSHVMVWRGQGGRDLLIDELRNKGVTVDVIELYQRQLPTNTHTLFLTWLDDVYHSSSDSVMLISDMNDKPLPMAQVLISSGESFANWQQLLRIQTCSNFSINDFEYIVLGERLADTMKRLHVRYKQIDNLQATTIKGLI